MLPDCSWIQQEQSGKVVTRLLVALASTSLVREADSSTNQKLSPQAGKVDTNKVSDRKGCGIKLPSCFTVPPSASLTLSSSPASGGAFGSARTNHTSNQSTRIRNLSHTCRANALRLRARRTRAADGNGHTNVNSHADIYTGYLIYATDNSANHTHNRSYTRSHAYSWPKGAGETVLA